MSSLWLSSARERMRSIESALSSETVSRCSRELTALASPSSCPAMRSTVATNSVDGARGWQEELAGWQEELRWQEELAARDGDGAVCGGGACCGGWEGWEGMGGVGGWEGSLRGSAAGKEAAREEAAREEVAREEEAREEEAREDGRHAILVPQKI